MKLSFNKVFADICKKMASIGDVLLYVSEKNEAELISYSSDNQMVWKANAANCTSDIESDANGLPVWIPANVITQMKQADMLMSDGCGLSLLRNGMEILNAKTEIRKIDVSVPQEPDFVCPRVELGIALKHSEDILSLSKNAPQDVFRFIQLTYGEKQIAISGISQFEGVKNEIPVTRYVAESITPTYLPLVCAKAMRDYLRNLDENDVFLSVKENRLIVQSTNGDSFLLINFASANYPDITPIWNGMPKTDAICIKHGDVKQFLQINGDIKKKTSTVKMMVSSSEIQYKTVTEGVDAIIKGILPVECKDAEVNRTLFLRGKTLAAVLSAAVSEKTDVQVVIGETAVYIFFGIAKFAVMLKN